MRKTINTSEPQNQLTQNNITAIKTPGAQPEFLHGGMFWGPGGWSRKSVGREQFPEPLETRGSGGRALSTQKILHLFAKITEFWDILIKLMLLKRVIEIGSANMIKLVA